MDNTPERNDDEYVREGGPYADLIRAGREGSLRQRRRDCARCALPAARPRTLRKAQRDWLKAEIKKGINSAERGEFIPAEEVFERPETKYRALTEKEIPS